VINYYIKHVYSHLAVASAEADNSPRSDFDQQRS